MGTAMFIVGVIVLLAGALALLFGADAELKFIGAVAGVIALVVIVLSTITIVQPRNVGVPTTFGKVGTPMDPGLHFKAPWTKVTDIDGTIQTRSYQEDNCLYVRIGDGSRSCVSLSLRWKVNSDQADKVYSDYRSGNPTEEVGSKLVSPVLKASLQKTLGDYNPVAELGAIKDTDVNADLSFAPDYDAVAKGTADGMKSRLGQDPLVDIVSVSVSYVSISDNTQAALDNFVKAVGETQQAKQQKQTADNQAAANKAISGSVSNDPNVLVSRCFDLISSGKFNPPVGFSCWPGGSGATVVPSAR